MFFLKKNLIKKYDFNAYEALQITLKSLDKGTKEALEHIDEEIKQAAKKGSDHTMVFVDEYISTLDQMRMLKDFYEQKGFKVKITSGMLYPFLDISWNEVGFYPLI